MTAPIPNLETDKDNADLLVATHSDRIRYAADSQIWYIWNGDKWEVDNDASTIVKLWTDIAEQWVRSYIDPQTGQVKQNRHRSKSLSATGIANMLYMLRRDPAIRILQAQFDCYPYELNTPNGIVDLKTGKVYPNDPNHLHTKQTKVSPDFDAPKQWLAFLDHAFQGDKEVIDWMQKLMGIAMIGEVVEQVMPFAVGQGGTGKSTFFDTIYKLMGDYAGTRDYTFLMRGQNHQHPEAVANLQGLRIVTMSEVNEGERFDEAKLKLLTGNDTLTGRQMGKPSYSFRPTHTLFLFGNTKPRVTESNGGVWRRMKLISFDNLPAKPDPTLGKRLEDESSQILGWLVEGARRYYQEGLVDPVSVAELTKQYEQDEDLVGQFVREECLVAQNAYVQSITLYQMYDSWARARGYKPVSNKVFTERLKSGKYGDISNGKRTSKGIRITGITLLPAEDEGSDVPTRF